MLHWCTFALVLSARWCSVNVAVMVGRCRCIVVVLGNGGRQGEAVEMGLS